MEISPTPTDEEAAAVVAAIEMSWPQRAGAKTASSGPPRWRFSGRWWTGTRRS